MPFFFFVAHVFFQTSEGKKTPPVETCELHGGKSNHVDIAGQISSRPKTRPGPLKGSVLEGNSPYFRKIQVGEILFHLAMFPTQFYPVFFRYHPQCDSKNLGCFPSDFFLGGSDFLTEDSTPVVDTPAQFLLSRLPTDPLR